MSTLFNLTCARQVPCEKTQPGNVPSISPGPFIQNKHAPGGNPFPFDAQHLQYFWFPYICALHVLSLLLYCVCLKIQFVSLSSPSWFLASTVKVTMNSRSKFEALFFCHKSTSSSRLTHFRTIRLALIDGGQQHFSCVKIESKLI